MLPIRRPKPGTAPAVLMQHEGRKKEPPVLRLIEYGPNFFEERKVERVSDLPQQPREGCCIWIEMNGLGDVDALRELGERFQLHPLALEDTLNTGQRPKFEMYEHHSFILVQMIYTGKNAVCCHEQVSFFVCNRILITVQEEAEYDVFEPVRERIRIGRGPIRRNQADYIAYALLDAIVDNLYPVLEELGTEIENLEDSLLEKPNRECAMRIHNLKRTLTKLRRGIWPERDIISAMMHDESGLITDNTKIFLRDCYDHCVQIMDLVESYRDVVSGLMDLYLSAVGMRTNEIMRVLTVISSVFIPLTFVAGLYGMNFDYADGEHPLNMPELHWPHGYVGCLLVMAIIAVAQVAFFKRKGWL